MKYRIRALKSDELPKLRGLIDLANGELSEVKFEKHNFEKSWEGLIKSEIGLVLVVETEDNEILGAFGGMIYPNPNNGAGTASQIFWFMHPGKRGLGVRLLKEFEEIAVEMGCTRIFTTSILNEHAERMGRMFIRKGYKPIETHWVKETTT